MRLTTVDLIKLYNKIKQCILFAALSICIWLVICLILSASKAEAFHMPEMDMCIIEEMIREKEEKERDHDRREHRYEREAHLKAVEKAENRKRDLEEWRAGQDQRDRDLFSNNGCFGTHDPRDRGN